MIRSSTLFRGFLPWIFSALALVASPAFGATVEYLHTDALGSIVAVTNSAGQVIERREYEPYGRQLTPALVDGPGYTGHVSDAATGLGYMQQRYYDPILGLFLSVDPVTAYGSPVSNFHRYRYANNNPYRFTDPDGRMVQNPWGDRGGGGLGRPFDNPCGKPLCLSAGDGGGDQQSRSPEEDDYYAQRAEMAERGKETFKEAGIYAAKEASWMLPIGRLFQGIGRFLRVGSHANDVPRSASKLIKWSEAQGFKRTQTAGGPIKYVDGNGVVRVTIKQGSSRAPGSGAPHVELRNAGGQRVDSAGNPVTRRSPENHTPIDWDID